MEIRPVLKPLAFFLTALALSACENPDFALGATINQGGISPTLGVSDRNISVVVRP